MLHSRFNTRMEGSILTQVFIDIIALIFNLGDYMKIDITMQQGCSDNKFSRKMARRIRLALNRFAASIRAITIRISDTNGPKGGDDIRCVVSVKLASAGEVVVQGEGEKVLTVLSHCLSRAERAVSRHLDRHRDTPIRMNRRRTKTEDNAIRFENDLHEYQF